MAQDVTDGEAVEGGTTEGSSPSEAMVPLSVMLAERKRHDSRFEAKVAELEGKINAVATKPEREFTRTELQAQVDDGRMTPDESDRIIQEQMKRTVTKEVADELKTENQTTARAARLQEEVEKYTTARPDIVVEGSSDRALIAKEFSYQTTVLGKPDNLATELDSLRAVLGPADRLQNGKDKPAQTFSDTGSDGGGTGSTDSTPKLPKNVKAHYEKLIGSGMYKGWDDPNLKAEVETYGARWG